MKARTARPVAALILDLVLIVGLGFVFLVSLSGCQMAPRHQRGGRTAQTLGFSVTAPATSQPGTSHLPAVQTLTQPENPEGESLQELTETTTTTAPSGEVVTVVKRARTVIGGSQRLADILKEYASTEYARRIALALVLGVVAFAVRKEWPSLQWVFGIGAVAVAFFGPLAVLGVAGAAGGLIVAYYIVTARLAAVAAPLP